VSKSYGLALSEKNPAPIFKVNLKEDYGLSSFSVDDVQKLHERIFSSNELTRNWMANLIGYQDETEISRVWKAYDYGGIVKSDLNVDANLKRYFCLARYSTYREDFMTCFQ